MRKTLRIAGFFLSGVLVLLAFQYSAYAYRDEVLTTAEEVWRAAKTVLTAKGIQREDWKNKIIKSKWIEDYVTKQKELFPSKLGINKTIPNTVRRRYRFSIELKETATGTEIVIAGDFQERPFSGVPSQLHWEKVSPSSEDYDLERAMFFKILGELERLRTTASR